MTRIVLTSAVLFNLHALDLKDQIQGLLFDLVKEKMVLWKQMYCLEVTAAIVAETLMEMGVNILLLPEEIHWPTREVTKPGPGPKKKKGGKKAKKKQTWNLRSIGDRLKSHITSGQFRSSESQNETK